MKKIIFITAFILATTGFMASAHAKYLPDSDKELTQKRKVDYFVECGNYIIHFLGYIDYDGMTTSTHVTITVEFNHQPGSVTIPIIYTGVVGYPVRFRKNKYLVKGKINADDDALVQILMSRIYLPKSGNVREVTFENFK